MHEITLPSEQQKLFSWRVTDSQDVPFLKHPSGQDQELLLLLSDLQVLLNAGVT